MVFKLIIQYTSSVSAKVLSGERQMVWLDGHNEFTEFAGWQTLQ